MIATHYIVVTYKGYIALNKMARKYTADGRVNKTTTSVDGG